MPESVRGGVRELIQLGPMPTDEESESQPVRAERWEQLVGELYEAGDVTDAEATELVELFPRDDSDCYGVAWTLVHVVESAPSWPLEQTLASAAGPWPELLRKRVSASAS